MAAILNERSQYVDADGKPLLGGKVFIGKVGLDPVANPEDIFSNPGLTTPLLNPQPINALGMTTAQIYVEGRYSLRVEDKDEVQHQQSLTVGTEAGAGNALILFDVSGTNAISAKASPTITEYVNGQEYRFQVPSANTGQMSLNIDLVGFKDITDSLVGLATAGQWISVYFNSTTDKFYTASTDNFASPRPFGNTTPNTIKATTAEFTTSIKKTGGAVIITLGDTETLDNSDVKIPTNNTVLEAIAKAGVLQTVQTDFGTLAITSANIPDTTTVPQSTEGAEFMTQPITPKNAASTLYIEVHISGSCDSADSQIGALFKDSATSAIAGCHVNQSTGNQVGNMSFNKKIVAGSTSVQTFRVRCGGVTGTYRFNGNDSGVQSLGGISQSSIKITEVGP